MKGNKPRLIVLSAPSGSGKTTIIKTACQENSKLILSVSYTTRAPRVGEVHDVDYSFVSCEKFQEMIQNDEFLEWAEVFGNFYGTSKKFIQYHLDMGETVILDIDVQGAMRLRELDDFEAFFLFIAPPSLEELKRRLIDRGTENNNSLEVRLGNAEHELTFQNRYDQVLINDDLERATKEFMDIIYCSA